MRLRTVTSVGWSTEGPETVSSIAGPAVDEFCATMRPRLLGVLTLQYGYHVAEELSQETLARVYSHWEVVRAHQRPEAWAFRVAFNLARSLLRRRRVERRAVDSIQPAAVEAAAGLDQADVIAIRDAVARLPGRQRLALVLRYYADLPAAEAAEVMGCREATVRSLTREALRTLRASPGLREDGDA